MIIEVDVSTASDFDCLLRMYLCLSVYVRTSALSMAFLVYCYVIYYLFTSPSGNYSRKKIVWKLIFISMKFNCFLNVIIYFELYLIIVF